MNPGMVVFFLVVISSFVLYYVTVSIVKKLINKEDVRLHTFVGAVLFTLIIANAIRLCWN